MQWNDRFQDEAFDEYAAFGIHYEGAKRLAEFFLEGVADCGDVFGGMKREPRREGALHVELAAVEHVQFEDEGGSLRIEAIADEIFAGLLDNSSTVLLKAANSSVSS